MKKLWEDNIFKSFLIWRILLFIIAFIAVLVLPFKYSFPYWDQELVTTHLPSWIWGFGNFDGVHYLRLAKMGYSAEYTQAFFPVYPMLVKLFSVIGSYFWSGFLVANISFVVALYFLYKLWRLDENGKVSFRSIILLLAFPTAYYFGAIYSESVFLLLSVLVMYLARKRCFLLAGVLAGLASATRVTGIFLWLVLLIEIWLTLKDKKYQLTSLKAISIPLALSLAPIGLVAYIIYLKLAFNNPLYFLTSQSAFGAGRGSSIILYPQVLVRYLKIFVTVQFNSYPFFTAVLEFLFGVIPLAGVIIFFRKIRLSYLAFILGCLFLPTLTGTFSSMPRYALMVFPALPLLAKIKAPSFKIVLVSFIMVQIVLLSLFVRGYWIA